MKKLWCALRGHKVDYFRHEPQGVRSLTYQCDCGSVFVSRKKADALVSDFYDFPAFYNGSDVA